MRGGGDDIGSRVVRGRLKGMGLWRDNGMDYFECLFCFGGGWINSSFF